MHPIDHFVLFYYLTDFIVNFTKIAQVYDKHHHFSWHANNAIVQRFNDDNGRARLKFQLILRWEIFHWS